MAPPEKGNSLKSNILNNMPEKSTQQETAADLCSLPRGNVKMTFGTGIHYDYYKVGTPDNYFSF